jgi:hypothetical protein
MTKFKKIGAVGLLLIGASTGAILAEGAAKTAGQSGHASTPSVSVGAQYDTTHVYVDPKLIDKFVASFLGTFGGKSTKQALVTVTPTASSTSSQLLQTPVGTVSLFGFRTPIPYPFGSERYGYLVKDLDSTVAAARADGAGVVVSPFKDPIGRDAIVQWPGGLVMQLYWHTAAPSYAPFQTVPDHRIYLCQEVEAKFVQDFLAFSNGIVLTDDLRAPGAGIGRPEETYHRIRIKSGFGNLLILVTDGHLPYPYGRETTGYGVVNLRASLATAHRLGVKVLVQPYLAGDREEAIVEFPGGYIAEMHARLTRKP